MMNFNFPEGKKPEVPTEVELGNVYASKNSHKTKAWIVMCISGGTVHLLGIDAEGEVSSTASYNKSSFERRNLIGVVDLGTLEFDIVPA